MNTTVADITDAEDAVRILFTAEKHYALGGTILCYALQILNINPSEFLDAVVEGDREWIK